MTLLKASSAIKLCKTDHVPSEILPRLFLGSIGAAFNKDSLRTHGITHILTCASNLKPRFPNVN